MGEKPYLRFVTATQQVYGDQALGTVAEDARTIAAHLNDTPEIPLAVHQGPVVTTAAAIRTVCEQTSADPHCAGLILWTQKASRPLSYPTDLSSLSKPHVRIQDRAERDAPTGRSRVSADASPIIVGAPRSASVGSELGEWTRAVLGVRVLQTARVAQFMTSRVEAGERQSPIGLPAPLEGATAERIDPQAFMETVRSVSPEEIQTLTDEYEARYEIQPSPPDGSDSRTIEEQARLELAVRSTLRSGRYAALTWPAASLPPYRAAPFVMQRLMEQGYGFAPADDFATAVLLAAIKKMGRGTDGGTTFLDDHSYSAGRDGMTAFGAHTREVCPTLAATKPRLVVPAERPGSPTPPRLVFPVTSGPAVAAALVTTTEGARLLVNSVNLIAATDFAGEALSRPVIEPHPYAELAATCWTEAGGSHRLVLSSQVSMRALDRAARIAGIREITIDRETTLRGFRRELRDGEARADRRWV